MSSKTMGPLLQVGTCPHVRWDWGSPLPHLRRDWAHPAHICAGTGITPATSAPGLGSPPPHLRWDCRNRTSPRSPTLRFRTSSWCATHRRALKTTGIAIIGTCTAIIGTVTAIIGTLIAIIGTVTAIIGTLIAIIGSRTAIIGTRGPIKYSTGYSEGYHRTPRRTLQVQFRLGLADPVSVQPEWITYDASVVDTPAHRALAKQVLPYPPARACCPASCSAGTTACSSRMRQRNGCMRTRVLRPRRAAWTQRCSAAALRRAKRSVAPLRASRAQAADQSLVLLKNSGALPLAHRPGLNLAVGPPTSAPGLRGLPPATSAPGPDSPMPLSAPGPGSSLPTSAPGLGPPLPTSAPGFARAGDGP
jgi:hypothetical protein